MKHRVDTRLEERKGRPWSEKRRKAYEEGLGLDRQNRKGTPLCFTIRSGYFCYNYTKPGGGTLYLGRDRDKAIAKALEHGITVFEKSASQVIPEIVDTGPGGCESFVASAVRPGWICCSCRHYTAWDDGPKCHHCGVYRCRELQKPSGAAVPGWDNRELFPENQ